jgi:uncharacterized HAD superfamily protein
MSGHSLRIAIDLDGVITDAFEIVLQKVNEQYGLDLTLDDIAEYNFLERVLAGSEERLAFVRGLYSDPDVCLTQARPLPGSQEAVAHLATQGHIVYFISSRDPDLWEGTIDWLRHYGFPANEGNVLLRTSASEDGIEFKCRMFEKVAANVVIEDDSRVAEAVGIPIILLDYAWNRATGADNVLRASRWPKVLSHIGAIAERNRPTGM